MKNITKNYLMGLMLCLFGMGQAAVHGTTTAQEPIVFGAQPTHNAVHYLLDKHIKRHGLPNVPVQTQIAPAQEPIAPVTQKASTESQPTPTQPLLAIDQGPASPNAQSSDASQSNVPDSDQEEEPNVPDSDQEEEPEEPAIQAKQPSMLSPEGIVRDSILSLTGNPLSLVGLMCICLNNLNTLQNFIPEALQPSVTTACTTIGTLASAAVPTAATALVNLAGLGTTTTATLGLLSLAYSLCHKEKRDYLASWVKNWTPTWFKNFFSPTSLATDAASSCLANTEYTARTPLSLIRLAENTWLNGNPLLSRSIIGLSMAYALSTNQLTELKDSIVNKIALKCAFARFTEWLTPSIPEFTPGSEAYEQYGPTSTAGYNNGYDGDTPTQLVKTTVSQESSVQNKQAPVIPEQPYANWHRSIERTAQIMLADYQ